MPQLTTFHSRQIHRLVSTFTQVSMSLPAGVEPRLNRAFDRSIYLVGVNAAAETFSVCGTTSNIYTVAWPEAGYDVTCTCPDATRGFSPSRLCKHAFFLLTRIGGLSRAAALRFYRKDLGFDTREGAHTSAGCPPRDPTTHLCTTSCCCCNQDEEAPSRC